MEKQDLTETINRSLKSIIAVITLNMIQSLAGLDNSMAAQYTKGLIVGGILFGKKS